MNTKGVYIKKGGTWGITFGTAINMRLKQKTYLRLGFDMLLIDYRPQEYETLEKESVNFPNNNTLYKKTFNSNGPSSKHIAPSFSFYSTNITAGFMFIF